MIAMELERREYAKAQLQGVQEDLHSAYAEGGHRPSDERFIDCIQGLISILNVLLEEGPFDAKPLT